MISAEGVLEAAVRGARVDEEGMAQLPHVAESLNGGGVDHREGRGVEPDVVPERVADDLERRQRDGPASRTAACTWSWNCSKFCRNICRSEERRVGKEGNPERRTYSAREKRMEAMTYA